MLTTSYFREITVHSSELLFEVWDQVSLTVTLTKFQGQFKILFSFLGLGLCCALNVWRVKSSHDKIPFQAFLSLSKIITFLFQGQKIGKSDAFMGLGIGESNKSNYWFELLIESWFWKRISPVAIYLCLHYWYISRGCGIDGDGQPATCYPTAGAALRRGPGQIFIVIVIYAFIIIITIVTNRNCVTKATPNDVYI